MSEKPNGTKRISVKKAEQAFRVSVCKINCQKPDHKIDKCISEEKGCLMHQVFTKLITK